MKTEELIALCARPKGFRVAELDTSNGDALRMRTDRLLRELEKQGRVFKAKISHRCVYWFATKEAAELAANVNGARSALRDAPVKVASRSPWPADAPAVVPAHVKVQKCPAFAPRFQAQGAIEFGLQRGRVTR